MSSPVDTPQSRNNEQPPANGDNRNGETLFMVCHGATCTCDKAHEPSPKTLHVVSHKKYIINDDASKLLATTLENNVAALNFGSCNVPSANNPSPCTAQLKWKDYYENVTLPGGSHVLTEKSTATCTAKGGNIKIVQHGQQLGVTPQQVNEAQSANWHNPLVEDVTILQSGNDDSDAPGADVKAIAPVDKQSVYPPGSTVQLKVTQYGKTPTEAEKAGINWMIMNDRLEPVILRQDTGETITAIFNKPGRYVVNAYGKNPVNGKVGKGDAVTYVEVKENEIGSLSDDSDSNKVRPNQPVTFSLKKLFPNLPLPGEGASDVQWTVQGNGVILNSNSSSATVAGSEAGTTFSVTATFNGVSKQSQTIKVMQNRITGIKADKDSCRVNDTLHFDVKDSFEMKPTPEELMQVKWKAKGSNGVEVPEFAAYTGATIQHTFKQAGEYTVQAYMQSPSDKIKVVVKVQQPDLKFASWRDKEGNMKEITGWNERNYLHLTFVAAEGLKVAVEVGVTDDKGISRKTVYAPAEHEIKDGHVGLSIYVDREKLKKTVKDGDRFYAIITCKTPGYTIPNAAVIQPAKLLKLKTQEEITGIKFYKDGKPVTSARYGDTLKCRVYARSLSTNELEVKIKRREKRWGFDNLRQDTTIHEGKYKVNEEGYAEFEFTLKKEWEKQYDEKVQQFYAEIAENEFMGAKATLTAFPVGVDAQASPQAPAKVEDNGNKEKKKGCPRCGNPFTLEEIKQAAVDEQGVCLIRNEEALKAALDFLNKHRADFGLDTCTRKAHFIAQVATETSFYNLVEGFNYAASVLKVKFAAFKTPTGRVHADEWGRPEGSKVPVTPENQEKIANWAYADMIGNGNYASGDGFKFRGRGFIQLTGRGNYRAYAKLYNKWVADKTVDWENKPDDIASDFNDAMAAAILFWRNNALAYRAEYADDYAVESVTRLINAGLDNIATRKRIFKEAVKALKVEDCELYKARKWQEAELGTVVVVGGVSKKFGEEKYVKGTGPNKIEKQWAVYPLHVYRRLTLDKYKELKGKNALPQPDYITYVARDAHGDKPSYGTHSDKRYGDNNECPPGEYYLNKKTGGQKYQMYVADTHGIGASYINGPHGGRAGIAIHGGWPIGAIGCMTMHTDNYVNNPNVSALLQHLPDMDLKVQQEGTRKIRIIIEEREVDTEQWPKPQTGTTKWVGRVTP
ncbi:PAAR-like protein [Chitinophaga vietnamensis]|uniref:PAAR-like protein n=1 Tax=Chitinophaga vietnamensis TaxID=2593957 RepID=UPI0011785EFD|nr:PAAR-like protein [Chitinophaga vietnamensis]